MNKRILVTGAEGFIGKYLLDELGNRGVEYLATDVISEEIVQKENYRKVSLLHKEEIRKVVRDYQPDVVVHLAAIALVTHENIPEIYEVNVCGTENLLSVLAEEQKNKTRVVLMSTAGVYGNQDAEFYDESLPYKPSNHYSFSKMVTEYLSKEYEESLDIKIVRPFNIIGTGQKETFLIPKLVKYFAERVDRIPLGNISSIRDYISVEYCAFVIAELSLRDQVNFKELNICSGIGHSGEDAVRFLETYTGHVPEIDITQTFVRKNEVWRLVGDPTRLHSFVGKDRGNTFEEILVNMLENYKG